MFWNRIFTNSLVFVVERQVQAVQACTGKKLSLKDETFNFDWISLETSAILSQVIKLVRVNYYNPLTQILWERSHISLGDLWEIGLKISNSFPITIMGKLWETSRFLR